MVMERFKSSACTHPEAWAWLSEQMRHSKLKLLWADANPEYPNGLYLTGEGPIYIPGFPGARALDEFDWGAGELRRVVRAPKPAEEGGDDIDPLSLTPNELLARYGYGATSNARDEPEEWVTEELNYRFAIQRASLVVAIDAVAAPTVSDAVISGPPAPATAAAQNEAKAGNAASAKSKLLRSVKEFLERHARAASHAETDSRAELPHRKVEWYELTRKTCGSAVTNHLFNEAWREADLPADWRMPGRRT